MVKMATISILNSMSMQMTDRRLLVFNCIKKQIMFMRPNPWWYKNQLKFYCCWKTFLASLLIASPHIERIEYASWNGRPNIGNDKLHMAIIRKLPYRHKRESRLYFMSVLFKIRRYGPRQFFTTRVTRFKIVVKKAIKMEFYRNKRKW